MTAHVCHPAAPSSAMTPAADAPQEPPEVDDNARTTDCDCGVMVDGLRNHDRQCERCQGTGLIFVSEDDEPPKVEEETMEAGQFCIAMDAGPWREHC